MKKLCLTATLAAATVCTLNLHGAAMPSLQRMAVRQALKNSLFGTPLAPAELFAPQKDLPRFLNNKTGIPTEAFASEEALAQFFSNKIGISDITGMLPEIARAAYLSTKGDSSSMPVWLRPYFEGVSVQDLIDNNMLKKIANGKLTLNTKAINDLKGLQNIPGINNVHEIRINGTQISTIDPDTFAGLTNLNVLDLKNNRIEIILPNAFADLGNLKTLILSANQIRTIMANTFTGLGQLDLLWLQRNNMESIILSPLKKVTIELWGNNISPEEQQKINAYAAANENTIRWSASPQR